MSTVSAATTNASTSTLKGAVKAADDDLSGWLKGLVTGAGTSPSHIILSGIIGVIPGLGQAMDVRDIVLGVMLIAKSPLNPLAWLEIAITLVGCVPVAGDALKTTFRLVKRGDSLPRILDGLSPLMRGNLEQWTRNINWADIGRSVKGSFDQVMQAFLGGLDSWVVKTVVGRGELDLLTRQIKELQQLAPKMLDEALGELQGMWSKALEGKLPKSTAASGSPRAPAALPTPATPAHSGSRNQPAEVERDRTATATATPDKPRNDERRAAKKSDSWSSGVMGEHITDYWCARENRSLDKANNGGKLWETHDKAGRNGIDHVWVQPGNISRPGVIGETKSNLLGAFRFLAALPADIRSRLNELGEGEAANLTPSGQPNIFQNDRRDTIEPSQTGIDGTKASESEFKKGLGRANADTGLKTQMSHAWIAAAMQREQLTSAGRNIAYLIETFDERRLIDKTATPPYERWVVMITGRQKDQHGAAAGHKHKIQEPFITLPDNILIE